MESSGLIADSDEIVEQEQHEDQVGQYTNKRNENDDLKASNANNEQENFVWVDETHKKQKNQLKSMAGQKPAQASSSSDLVVVVI